MTAPRHIFSNQEAGNTSQGSILNRVSSADFVSNPSLTSLQVQVDGLVSHFVQEATDPITLAAMVAGGMAYRLGRVGVMSYGARTVGWPLLGTSYAVGLGCEVTAYELTHRSLISLSLEGEGRGEGGPSRNLWSWSGPGGWAQGLASSVMSFGMLKGAGFLAREQNIVLQHLFQSTAMVSGHQVAGAFGFIPPPEGSLAQQFLEAERMNISLGAGMALLHSVLPRMAAFERSLDLINPSPWRGTHGERQRGWPPFAYAVGEEALPIQMEALSIQDPLPQAQIAQMTSIGDGSARGEEKPFHPEMINRLSVLLGGELPLPSGELERVAEHFSTDPVNLERWIPQFRILSQSVGRAEPRERNAETLYEILNRYRDRPEILNRLLHFFLFTANDYQEPQRRLQTFSDALNLGLGAVHLYERLGASMNAAHPRSFGRQALGEGYFLQISPGEGEAAGGLHFTLLREEGNLLPEGGTPLAEIGLLVGLDRVQVAFVQGEKGHYSAHVNRLRPLLGRDPFDWLLEGASAWARLEGFKTFQAYPHTHNYWLRNRLEKMGTTAEAYRAHLTRLYEGRFGRLGLKAHSVVPEILEKPLSQEEPPPLASERDSILPDLMKKILRPREDPTGNTEMQVARRLSELLRDDLIGKDFQRAMERDRLENWLDRYLNLSSSPLKHLILRIAHTPEIDSRKALRNLSTSMEALKAGGASSEAALQVLSLLLEKSGARVDETYQNLPLALAALKETPGNFNEKINFLLQVSERLGERMGHGFLLFSAILPIMKGKNHGTLKDPPSLLEPVQELLLFAASLSAQESRQKRQVHQMVEEFDDTLTTALKMSLPHEFSTLVESLQAVPFGRFSQIEELREIAIEVSKKIDVNVWGDLRTQIHNYPSRDNIRLVENYLQRAQGQSPPDPEVIKKLEKALRLTREIYDGQLNLSEISDSLSQGVLQSLDLPPSETPTLEEISSLAISVRHYWDSHRGKILPKEALALARLSISLQKFAFAQCAVEKDETGRSQAQKMAALISVLYGSGYGNRGWAEIGLRLQDLYERWEHHFEETRSKYQARQPGEKIYFYREDYWRELRLYLPLVHEMLLQVQDHYHDHLDPLIEKYGSPLGLGEEKRALYPSNQYRSMSVFQLQNHLNKSLERGGNRKVALSVLNILSLPSLSQDLAEYRAYFYHDPSFPEDIRVTGGKGLGLRWITTWVPENVPQGFVLPPRHPGSQMSEGDRALIWEGIEELERRTGQKMGEDLSVSVRSGAAISMPGTMKTQLNVKNKEDVLQYVEAVYQSWENPASREYRLRNGILDNGGTAVNIVAMVDGERDASSGSGVASSSAAVEKKIEIVYGQRVKGERLVRGEHPGSDPLPTPELREDLEQRLLSFEWRFGEASGLHHPVPVEVEFTIESGRLYFLQIRAAHFSPEEEIRWYTRRVRENLISREAAIVALGGIHRLRQVLQWNQTVMPFPQNPILYDGESGIGPPVSGEIAFNIDQISTILARGARAIFVTNDPDAESSAQGTLKAGAVLVSGGNPLSHLVSLTKSIPHLTYMRGHFRLTPHEILILPGEQSLRNGTRLTLDPRNGRIYEGEMDILQGESPVDEEIRFLLGGHLGK